MAEIVYFQKELFRDNVAEFMPLFYEHHKEIDKDNHDVVLSPNWDQYLKLEVAGALHILTCRDNSTGQLVGYFFAMVWPSLHFSQEISAVSDIFYLNPAYRKNGIGNKLLKTGEEMVTNLGATRGYLVTKEGSNASIVVERMGYELVERIYFKDLKRG